MVKQAGLSTPVLGEVLTNLAPLRMKHSASVPAYHKGNPTWLSLYLFACALTHRPSFTLCKGISLLCDEGLIDRFNRWFKIFIFNTDDDIKLRRTLIDHLDIDALVCESSEELSGCTTG